MADFSIPQGDTAPALTVDITGRDGAAPDLSAAGTTIYFIMSTDEGETPLAEGLCDKIDVTPGNAKVRYVWQAGDTDVSGTHKAEWEVRYADGTRETFPSDRVWSIYIRPQLGSQP